LPQLAFRRIIPWDSAEVNPGGTLQGLVDLREVEVTGSWAMA